ncbi:hypothetical protein Acsp05_65450 [Actinokineospora sp. NBRC 105648]|nr:hypothetical protein Acsp05_65450 [Actinokineospora sp. NBRC 105648]
MRAVQVGAVSAVLAVEASLVALTPELVTRLVAGHVTSVVAGLVVCPAIGVAVVAEEVLGLQLVVGLVLSQGDRLPY